MKLSCKCWSPMDMKLSCKCLRERESNRHEIELRNRHEIGVGVKWT